jgi:hypothetical protein
LTPGFWNKRIFSIIWGKAQADLLTAEYNYLSKPRFWLECQWAASARNQLSRWRIYMTEATSSSQSNVAPGSEISVRGQEVNNIQANSVTLQQGSAQEIQAAHVLVSQAGAGQIKADSIELRQAGAQTIAGQQVNIRQGGVVQARSEQLSITQGGLVFAETGEATLTASTAGAVLASGNVTLDQSIARVVLSRGDVTVDQGGSGLVVGRNVRTGDNSGTIFILAGRVEGEVKAMFGPVSSAAFGAGFALIVALLIWLKNRLVQQS